MTVSVDLRDPAVKRLMGHGGKRELVHLAGDQDTGLSSTIQMDHNKREVTVTYSHGPQDFVLTVDVYSMPGEPLQVHLICPKCKKPLRITADRKAIDFDVATGKLSVEPFQCTWEVTNDKHTPGIISGGLTLCKWTAAIERNVARDA